MDEKTKIYKGLMEFLTHHRFMGSMPVTRRMPPMQEAKFFKDNRLLGAVSGYTIKGWKVNKNNTKVKILLNNDTDFIIPVIKDECIIKSFSKLMSFLHNNVKIKTGGKNNFKVEKFDKNELICTYEEFGTLYRGTISKVDFVKAEILNDLVRVYFPDDDYRCNFVDIPVTLL